MLDRFMVLDYEHLTSPLGSCSHSQGGYRQYIQVELVSGANKLVLTVFLPAAFRQTWQFIFH